VIKKASLSMILHGVVIYIDYVDEIMGFACLLACWLSFFFFLFIESHTLSHHVAKGMEICLSMVFPITSLTSFVLLLFLLDCL
jgi:hypothetical protein